MIVFYVKEVCYIIEQGLMVMILSGPVNIFPLVFLLLLTALRIRICYKAYSDREWEEKNKTILIYILLWIEESPWCMFSSLLDIYRKANGYRSNVVMMSRMTIHLRKVNLRAVHPYESTRTWRIRRYWCFGDLMMNVELLTYASMNSRTDVMSDAIELRDFSSGIDAETVGHSE